MEKQYIFLGYDNLILKLILMNLRAVKITEAQAKEISSWRYDGEYAIYNLPIWDKMIEEGYSLCNDAKRDRYIAYLDDHEKLIGFVNLLNEGDTVFFGIGINPNFCGIGIGKMITKMGLIESQKRFPNKTVVLEVRTWNKRAVNCYKSQCFEIVETKKQETKLGPGEFYFMEYNPVKTKINA